MSNGWLAERSFSFCKLGYNLLLITFLITLLSKSEKNLLNKSIFIKDKIIFYYLIMYCYDFHVVMQEVPGEISLCFTISGCPLRCEGCHSPFLWKEGSGSKISNSAYKDILYRYFGFASCVVFMGGEWHKYELIKKLKYAQEQGYKTCLYTGYDEVDSKIMKHLTWIKTGGWDRKLGGLNSKTTNQVFREVKTNKILNHLFISN